MADERLLDGNVRVGISTPRADPSGDDAFQMFERIESSGTAAAGSAAALEAKAPQLTGGPGSPQPPAGRRIYGMLVDKGKADIFITYCTNATEATTPCATGAAHPGGRQRGGGVWHCHRAPGRRSGTCVRRLRGRPAGAEDSRHLRLQLHLRAFRSRAANRGGRDPGGACEDARMSKAIPAWEPLSPQVLAEPPGARPRLGWCVALVWLIRMPQPVVPFAH
ncbi:MAG: substrate-binding domain-containing protein [Burkholderiaceae bacterium]|nr:substrate-binding domain-containing protein [Burkholderiaceae bacterium]